jgi:PAS domain S-box-containing protein
MTLTDNPLLKTIIESAPIGICIVSADDFIVEMLNDKFVEIAGKPEEAIIGRCYWDPFAEVRESYEEALNSVAHSGKTYYADEAEILLLRHGKEEMIVVTFVYAPVLNEQGEISKIAIWVLENTAQVRERRTANAANVIAMRERDHLHKAFRRAPTGICVLSGDDMVYELVNEKYQAFLPGRLLLGRPFAEALPEFINTPLLDSLKEVYNTGKTVELTDQLLKVAEYDDGPTVNRYFSFTIVPRFDTSGKVDGIYNFVLEVTETLNDKLRAGQLSSNLLQILNMLPASVVVIRGYDLVVEMINDSNLAYWQKSKEQVLGKRFLDILPDIESQPFAGQLRNVIETGEILDVKESPVYFTADDGSIRETFVDYTYQPLADHEGNRNGVLVMSFEITDQVRSRKLIEKYAIELSEANIKLQRSNDDLARSESRFKYLFKEAPVAIGVLTGRDLVVESANSKILEVWGKQPDIVGQPLAQALPELVGQPFLGLLDEVYTSGKAFYANEIPAMLEHEGQLKEIFFNATYQPIFDNAGNTTDILVVAVNVTEQVRSRRQVEKSEDHFRHLADLVPAKISNALPTGEVFFFNKQWLDFAGMNFEDMRDFGYQKMMHPDELTGFKTGLAEAAETGVPYISEMRFKNTSGEYIWHLNIASPILNEEGKITMWVGSTTNIQVLKDEVQRKSDFVSMLSHELKTPVTSIKGHVQLLLRSLEKSQELLPGSRVRASISRIDQLLVQLTGLIADMLDLTRIDAGRMELQKELFMLDVLVAEVLEDFKLSHLEHQFAVSLSPDVAVMADRNKISQVLINLIANAVKYAPKSKKIEVSLSATQSESVIAVRDYGIGIDAKDQHKIFERFFRVEGQSELHYSGFGIGLYLANSIMHSHKGKISLESSKGEGSTFIIHIPM